MKIRYNPELGVLEKALADCKKGAMFLCKGETELPMPRIEVKDVGVLSYPVRQDQLQSMIERATRAPFGKGTETITDLNVRRVWQIQNTDINITGIAFESFFTSITNSIKESMGLTNEVVTAELYKLLVYDKGSFFLPHRDSEKADNMFGTLVLSLPCPHRGGDLVVNHSGRDEVVSLENDSMSTIKWTAFFADCQHEVKPVTEGNRVCLVYNLLRSGGTNVDINISSEPITQAFNQVFGLVSNKADEDMEEGSSGSKSDNEDEEDDDDNNNNNDNKIIKMAKTSPKTNKTTKYDFGDDDDESHSSADNEYRDEFNEEYEEEEYYEDMDKDEGEGKYIPEKIIYSLEHVYSLSNFRIESLKGGDATLARTLLAFSNESRIRLALSFIHITEKGGGECMVDPKDTVVVLKDVKDLETGTILEEKMKFSTKEILPDGCLKSIKPYSLEAQEATGNEGVSFDKLYRQSAIVIWSTVEMGKFTMISSMDVALEMLEKELTKLGGIDANPLATQQLFNQLFKAMYRLKPTPQNVTRLLNVLRSIKPGHDQHLPMLLQTMLQTVGGQIQTDLHQDALVEMILQRPTMTHESIERVMSQFVSSAPQSAVMDMFSKLLVLSEPSTATVLPMFADQIIPRLTKTDQCDQLIDIITSHQVFKEQRQHLLDRIIVVARAMFRPKLNRTRYMQGNDRDSTFHTTISMIDHFSTALNNGKAPIYFTDAFLGETYRKAIKVLIQTNQGYLNFNIVLPAFQIMERITAAHPEWIAGDQKYIELLKKLSVFRSNFHSHKHNQIANQLFVIWKALHNQEAIINDFLGHLCSKPHQTFGIGNVLWEHVAKLNLEKSTTKPDPNDKSMDVEIHCECEQCGKIKVFLQSQDEVLDLPIHYYRREHVETNIGQLKLDQKKERDTNNREMWNMVLTKTDENKHAKMNKYVEVVNNCHSLSKIRPTTTPSSVIEVVQKLDAVVAATPEPQKYPHLKAKVKTIPLGPKELVHY
ncbi:hypothetical protein SAMD00019534_072200 [Acytostelium subglobosum LB1]|uniref:hypothetical protein n=1 Tax=Acytostelium subglobosum LB1 TaxID=1410327 RepID=UPI0006449397|nr:hypothetical protein SAMD00019534_072200 [Acytostelium subglobosum LB1]GAM24045.1 hypothetical protein SAMD00019534_072200 [Acytostelium subglobosum LB1]|eukprot:XP_012753081.1 hypothetical protein SAMD00019534_072200 [Acytostelium subglobosum LB1]